MKEIEFLKHLIADAEHELNYIELYREAKAVAREDDAKWETYCNMRVPSKQRIKDDLKMVRRITLGLERRMEQ